MYEGAEKRGEKNWRVYARLGDCYYYTSRPKIASFYYKQALRNKNIDEKYLLNYALSLQSSGAPDTEVIAAFRAYYEAIDQEYIEGRRIVVDTAEYEIKNSSSINGPKSDFGTFIIDSTFYFSSSRENPDQKRRINKRLYKWNEQPFLDIYSAQIIEDSDSLVLRFITPDSSDIGINTYAHESVVSISNNHLYYSGGDVKDNGEIRYNKNGSSVIKLRRASLVEGKWKQTTQDKEVMEFLDFELYSMSSPSFYQDKNILFFASCAPFRKAKGKTDLYYVNMNPDSDAYKKIKSVPGVNTSGREGFPFVSSNGTLYFSSDGIYDNKLSLGLLDLYRVENIHEVINDEATPIVEHLGAPFNSDKDDFAFYMDESNPAENCTVNTYFSSNREFDGAQGDDDIYRFKMKVKNTVNGQVRDSITNEVVENAKVYLFDPKGIPLDSIQTNADGKFSFKVNCDQLYRMRADKPYFTSSNQDYQYDLDYDEVNLQLVPLPCEISKQIGFGYKKDTLTIQAKVDLLPIIEILIKDRDVQIHIESHTDQRGSEDYNQKLSDRRAKSTKDYLIEFGVLESQILSAKGFGKRCPINREETINNAPESERENLHAENRRSRFILSICKDNIDSCSQQSSQTQSN